MEDSGKLMRTIGILVLCCISFTMAPVCSEEAPAFAGTETCISTATWGTDQTAPAVWEDRIVWSFLYVSPDPPWIENSDVYFYNITSGEYMRIPTNLPYQSMPDIWEDRIVWQAYQDDNFEIHLFNLSTGEDLRLTNDSKNQVRPRIWGDVIVWQNGDDWETEHEVSLYDITTGNATIIAGSAAMYPAIWGDRVVFEDGRNASMGDYDIYLYNTTTGTETRITSDPFAQTSPSIWEGRIVWMDNRDISTQVYSYDLETGTEIRITEGDYYRENPVISSDIVVFENETFVTCVDLDTMAAFPLSTDMTAAPKDHPDIWGGRVVWSDMRSGDFDIYLYTIGTIMRPLIADFRSNTTQGEAPLTLEFTDSSEGQVDGWFWDFGDTTTSNDQNPVHTFTSPGSYSVILTVFNPYQRDAKRRENFISVGSEPVPRFTQNRTSGPAPLVVQFNDSSAGLPVEWQWDFGDGGTSQEQSPVYTFTIPGVYSVNLTASNTFGTASVHIPALITVKEGTFHISTFPSSGIGLSGNGTDTLLSLNTSEAGTCTPGVENGIPVIRCTPPPDSSVASMMFFGDAVSGFSDQGDGILTGLVRNSSITSKDLQPANMSTKIGSGCFYNFTLTMPGYEPGRTIQTVAWEGSTPDDLSHFETAKVMYNYGAIEDIAYTVQFGEDPDHPWESTVLIFGVGSDWVHNYGWGDNGTLPIDTSPGGARVYVDGIFSGYSPTNVTGLSPGMHTVRLMKRGYDDFTLSMEVRDERDSIHVIRIGDDGNSQVLPTHFIGHDDARDLDLFIAESPWGHSTFGLASLSKSGNFFQMLYMSVSASVAGGGGGGGGGGSSGDVAGPAVVSTTVPAGTIPPALTPLPTLTAVSSSPGEPAHQESRMSNPPENSLGESGGATMPAGEGRGETIAGSLVEGTTSLVLLKNLSVVFVVVLVTLIFYMRWIKREQ